MRSKGGKQGLSWAARQQGIWHGANTWPGADTWHQVTWPPPVSWTHVAVVRATSHRGRWRGAWAWRVGGEWGSCATWWSIGAPPVGSLPKQERRCGTRQSARCPRTYGCSDPLRATGAEELSKDSLKQRMALEPDRLGRNPGFVTVFRKLLQLCASVSSWV